VAWKPEPQTVDGCWLWAGGKTAAGYGQHRRVYVHRASFEAYVGPIPNGYQVDHLCRVRACYNPAHLDAVSEAENVRRQPNVIAQLARTHCPWGHAYDESMRRSTGKRHCRACNREKERARRKRKKMMI